MPAVRARIPPASSLAAIQGSEDSDVATLMCTVGRDPSAFMAATVQLAPRSGQVGVWVPGPAARGAQMPARAGAVAGAPPVCRCRPGGSG
jgi:hypothetical protein